MLEDLHSRDIAELARYISFHPNERIDVLCQLERPRAAAVLLHLSKYVLRDVVPHLPKKELIAILEHLDPDEVTDLIQLLPRKQQTYVIEKLKVDLREQVSLLAQFDPKTAAGLMNMDYIQVEIHETAEDIAKQFRAHEKRTSRLPDIVVMDNGKPVGFLPVHELGLLSPTHKIREKVRPLESIKHDADIKTIVERFKTKPHHKMAVIGPHGNVIGIIYSDDLLRLLSEESSASLYDFAGVVDEETVTDDVSHKVHHRYKWLVINLGTAFLASSTVSLFQGTISQFVLLAAYMPIVAGMGGNAATQTLAVMVRGISNSHVTLKDAWPIVRREWAAGFLNGSLIGILVAGIVIVVNRNWQIAVILAAAMIINLMVAGIFGTLVPLIMQRLGKDPATSASIFITTATDVLGFFAFLGLATVLLT